jgi:hypothetical protein
VLAADKVTAQGPVPLQPAPDQPEKVKPCAAVAVKVTTVPSAKEALQVALQAAMPVGLELTVPPALDCTLKVCVGVPEGGGAGTGTGVPPSPVLPPSSPPPPQAARPSTSAHRPWRQRV